MTSQAESDYVVAGFLTSLFEPWVQIVAGDEWGEMIDAFWQVAHSTQAHSDSSIASTALGWLRLELQAAVDEDWWDQSDELLPGIVVAREQYDEIVAYWRERAKSFGAAEALEACIADLPEWVKPASIETRKAARIASLEEEVREAQRRLRVAEGTLERERSKQRAKTRTT